MKILLINSDLAKNRGDRAIAEGIIMLAKQRFPEATITGISQQPERDSQWFGIDFLNMNFQSLNPLDFLRLARAARSSDIVLWGGGEILKDYTNKAALWYWVLKICALSVANKNIYGAYQGIGPTKSAFSRRLIAFVAGRTKKFIVRDDESRQKLIDWGAPATKIIASSDPAVLPVPDRITPELYEKLHAEAGITEDFMANVICIGPRDWFHYTPGGLIPFKYKRKLLALAGKSADTNSPRHDTYVRHLSELLDHLLQNYDANILLTPMHMEESDSALAHLLRDKSGELSRVKVLDSDVFSAQELRSIIGAATAMVGFRLHSNIIGISSGVPSINIYYVDKGRVFFDQIGQSHYALPIETVLEDDFVARFAHLFAELYAGREDVRQHITASTETLRAHVRAAFAETFPESPHQQ